MTKIIFSYTPTIEDSLALVHLKDLIIENTSLKPTEKIDKISGAKGDVPIALEIINIGLTLITSFIAVLEFWKSQHPKYSLTIVIGDNTFSKENISKEELESELRAAQEKQENPTIIIS